MNNEILQLDGGEEGCDCLTGWTGDGLRCWLCLIRAAVKLGLEIMPANKVNSQPGGVKIFLGSDSSFLSNCQ